MALAISITTPCAGCISYHVDDALKAGASHAEVLDAIGVAVMMSGGPRLIYELLNLTYPKILNSLENEPTTELLNKEF